MDDGIAPITGVPKPAASPAPGRKPVMLRAVQDAPPEQVRQELDTAARVIEELSSRQVNLHFEVDPGGSEPVRVQVRDANGNVLREIPSRSLFETLAGGGLLIDQRG
jgi:uncharacterized FlaG/YvyC family protein